MCCLIFSSRGLTYFGITIHLIVGLLVVPLITLFGAFSGKTLSKFDVAFMSAYACGTLVTAFLVFRGIRKDSVLTLKLSGALLFLFQVGALVIMLMFWRGSGSTNRGKPTEVLRVMSVIINCLCTVTYLIVLVCYIRHIRKKQRRDFTSESESF